MPDSWNVNYAYNDLKITLRLALTGFGHVGIFPEQGNNWNFIYDTIASWNTRQARVINLFAYTGAASVAARSAGADMFLTGRIISRFGLRAGLLATPTLTLLCMAALAATGTVHMWRASSAASCGTAFVASTRMP